VLSDRRTVRLPDLSLDHLAELLQLGLVALDLQPPLQRVGSLPRGWPGGLLARSGQPGQQPVRVDGPQRAEHVVGAGHRPARLDPGVPVHEQARDRAQHDLVALTEGGQQQFGQGGVVEGAEALPAPGPAPGAVAVLAVRPARSARRGRAGLGVPGGRRRGLRRLRGEVQVEDRIEGELVIMGLHQDRPQGGLHRGAVVDRQVPQALHRVDPLGDRDRDADLAQFGDHAFYGGEHGPASPVVRGTG